MRLEEIKKIVSGTADAAFALDSNGLVAAWNNSAASIFGLNEFEALGKSCHQILRGIDECGRNCSENCTIRQQAQSRQPLKNYDIQLQTKGAHQWFNVSVLIIEESKSVNPYTIHIVRPADLQKRFELLMRDFVVKETTLPVVNVSEILTVKNTPTNITDLSKREIEILKCLAKGESSQKIADRFFISRTTVNNHVQNILKKLNAHTRLEAVRFAEQTGLI